jgi:ankyrin repeat protein
MVNSKEDIQKFVKSEGNISLMKKMLDDGTITDINISFDNGLSTNTALMFESIYGTIEGMKFLLTRKADPNIQDKNGLTALHKIVNLGEIDKQTKVKQLAKLRLLLEYGADKNIKNHKGITALELAKCSTCCNDCIKVIKTYKPNSKNKKTLRKKGKYYTKKNIKHRKKYTQRKI